MVNSRDRPELTSAECLAKAGTAPMRVLTGRLQLTGETVLPLRRGPHGRLGVAVPGVSPRRGRNAQTAAVLPLKRNRNGALCIEVPGLARSGRA